MARKVYSINLEEKTVEGIDELAKKMNSSRSQVVEMVMSVAVQKTSLSSFYKSLAKCWMAEENEESASDSKPAYV